MKELKRKEKVKRYLTFNLKQILEEAKMGYKNCAKADIQEMEGMILYAKNLDDITEETYEKIHKLLRTIQKKYEIY